MEKLIVHTWTIAATMLTLPTSPHSQMPCSPNSRLWGSANTQDPIEELYDGCLKQIDLFALVLQAGWISHDIKDRLVHLYLGDHAMHASTHTHVQVARVLYHEHGCSLLWDALLRSDLVAMGERTFVLCPKNHPAIDMADLIFPKPEEVFGVETITHTIHFLRTHGAFTWLVQERILHRAVQIALDTYQQDLFEWAVRELLPEHAIHTAKEIGWI